MEYEILQWNGTKFFKLASNESVKTASVFLFFFFHFYKYYGQNIFSRITVLYLIAKVKRKEETFCSKHEIIFCQKEKRSKMFQVKAISEDVRKTIVCCCYVTYVFQSESTLYNCLNVKELLA